MQKKDKKKPIRLKAGRKGTYEDTIDPDFDEEYEEAGEEDLSTTEEELPEAKPKGASVAEARRRWQEGRNRVAKQQISDQGPVKKVHKKGIAILLGILLLVIIVGYYISRIGSEYSNYQILSESEIIDSTLVDYMDYEDNCIKYSKDGATYIDKKGIAVWTESYAFKTPKAVVRGEYIAIADVGGNEVSLYNKEGLMDTYTMPYTIMNVDLAEQGAFAVSMEGDQENFINLYDKTGEEIATVRTTIANNGYPLDIALSEDGQKLFVSYITIDGINAVNTLTAYNFGTVGQNENADRMVGSFSLKETNTIVPQVEFLDNDTICAFGDNHILIYSMREKPKQKADIEVATEIRSVFYCDSYVGIIADNDNAAADDPYVMRIYSTGGRQMMKRSFNINYNQVKADKNEIILLGENQCLIYDTSGRMKFTYDFTENINNIIATNRDREYILLTDSKSTLIRLNNKSQDTPKKEQQTKEQGE